MLHASSATEVEEAGAPSSRNGVRDPTFRIQPVTTHSSCSKHSIFIFPESEALTGTLLVRRAVKPPLASPELPYGTLGLRFALVHQ